ncbi:hypothetical protein DMENIID0001_132520 [Sergentomyia squamirostris]
MSQISEYLEEMFNEHLVQEVEVQGDVTLFQICEEFGAQDEYSFLIAAGITFSLLQNLTEEDVNAILPETYFKPKSKLNPSYKGMLYDKYHNNKKEPGMKSKSRKNTDTTEAAVNSQEAERSRDEKQADNDVTDKSTVVIFASDGMSSDMIRQWKITSLDRIASITSS